MLVATFGRDPASPQLEPLSGHVTGEKRFSGRALKQVISWSALGPEDCFGEMPSPYDGDKR
jgi:hypothetical protein